MIQLSELIFSDGSLSDRNNKLSALFNKLKADYSSCTLITDSTVHSLYGKLISSMVAEAALPCSEVILPPGESSKTLLSANTCWDSMAKFGADRNSCVVALGGGVVSDLAGFAAGCYMRGIDLILIPTTLLGMADAAIGGKAAVNTQDVKNLIGCFHLPVSVFLCPSFLQTLPEREFTSGLAEVIKYGVIRDPVFFESLESQMDAILARSTRALARIVHRSALTKTEIVLADPLDTKDIRASLNWGHTFAHAIESTTQYRTYLHGEAVAIGMQMAAVVSENLGYADTSLLQRQESLLKQAGLPTTAPDLCLDQVLDTMQRDKKANGGKISLIVAEKIGNVFRVKNVDRNRIKEALVKRP